MKKLIKYLIKMYLFHSGYALKKMYSQNLKVLCYHRFIQEKDIIDDMASPDSFVNFTHFRNQLLTIKKYGTIIDPDEFLHHIKKNIPFTKSTWLITVDDGWYDNYQCFKNVLPESGIRVLLFMVTNFINSIELYWTQELWFLIKNCPNSLKYCFSNYEYETIMQGNKLVSQYHKLINTIYMLSRKSRISTISKTHETFLKFNESKVRFYLDNNELVDLIKDNVVLGSHSCNHEPMVHYSKHDAIEEFRKSKEILENISHRNVDFFSFPHSSYNNELIELAKNTNYLGIFGGAPSLHIKQHRNFFNRIDIAPQYSYSLTNAYSEAVFISSLATRLN